MEKRGNFKTKRRKEGFVILLVIIPCILVLGMAAMFVAGISGQYTGVNSKNNSAGGDQIAYNDQVDCSGVANVPSKYMSWVKDAASKYLGGDDALLIALVQNESGWDPHAKNISSSTHAVGLGQFQPGSARGWPEFVGGDDKHGMVWPTGKVYDGMPPADDTRFDAKRSIYAAAHYLSSTAKLHNGDYFMGYEKNYHGGSYGATARKKMEEYYAKVRKGCTVLFGAADGNATGVVRVDTRYITFRSADIRMMPQAAQDFNAMAEDFNRISGRKLDIVSMFRSRAQQISMCGTVVNGRCSRSSEVAPPGKSMHEAGLAVDIGLATSGRARSSQGLTRAQYEQFKAAASRHRFAVNNGSGGRYGVSESWHFDYIGLKDKYWYGPTLANAIKSANGSPSNAS
ncbi:MAG: D-alanyl-D-alanine carboxypeptidase family protein [bacterium]|nr:D-alanyl-D-alanine carboxypeptidase family protein [bacterium]